MTIAATLEELTYHSSDGARARGLHREVISGVTGGTRTLLAKESGALCLFDSAAGIVYTLPAPTTTNIGMYFDFQTTVTITSNAAKIITDAATTFLIGDLQMILVAAATTLAAAANGTTIRAVSSNGSTTGGVIGDRYRVTLVSTTLWAIDGYVSGTGSLATPFATS
jgi:hypothetical protein